MDNYLNKIIQGNCLEVMANIPNNSIDLIIVDPPYGISYKEWDKFDNFIEFSEQWIKECFRVLKDNGSFYSFMGWSNVAEFKLLLDKYGTIRNWITWHRTKGRGSSKNYKSMKEEILYYVKSDTYTWNEQKMLKQHVFPYVKDGLARGWFTNDEGIKCRWTGIGNVWFYMAPFWKMPEYCGHPSQKPIMMMERMVLSSSNEGDTVLEPFCGSAPVCMAAKKLGRNYIGIETNPEYVEIVNSRLSSIE